MVDKALGAEELKRKSIYIILRIATMAKIIKMNPPPKGNKDFKEFCIGLPQDMQERNS
jgi:hypothetical protein